MRVAQDLQPKSTVIRAAVFLSHHHVHAVISIAAKPASARTWSIPDPDLFRTRSGPKPRSVKILRPGVGGGGAPALSSPTTLPRPGKIFSQFRPRLCRSTWTTVGFSPGQHFAGTPAAAQHQNKVQKNKVDCPAVLRRQLSADAMGVFSLASIGLHFGSLTAFLEGENL